MPKKARRRGDDLRGAARLATEATTGVTSVVEQMHRTIGSGPAVLGRPLEAPTRLVTSLVYGGIRGVTKLVGGGLDVALAQLAPLLGDSAPGPDRDAVLAALNGVLGDHLDETNNPLAIEMELRRDGRSIEPDSAALRAALPRVSGKLLILVHGACMNDRQWCRNGHDHGAALERDLGCTPIYLHYNTGRHISTNGHAFAALLERLVSAWPVPVDEVAIVAHSMGGLVTRSACHCAELAHYVWRDALRKIVFLGTPHHGSPLERGGNWIDVLLGVSRYSAPLARLGKIRSAGVTDLRFGNVLDEHWQGRDRFEPGHDRRSPLPLPQGVASYAFAAVRTEGGEGKPGGDGLVPLESALGRHKRPEMTLRFPDAHQRVGIGLTHFDLLDRTEVYEAIAHWLRG